MAQQLEYIDPKIENNLPYYNIKLIIYYFAGAINLGLFINSYENGNLNILYFICILLSLSFIQNLKDENKKWKELYGINNDKTKNNRL